MSPPLSVALAFAGSSMSAVPPLTISDLASALQDDPAAGGTVRLRPGRTHRGAGGHVDGGVRGRSRRRRDLAPSGKATDPPWRSGRPTRRGRRDGRARREPAVASPPCFSVTPTLSGVTLVPGSTTTLPPVANLSDPPPGEPCGGKRIVLGTPTTRLLPGVMLTEPGWAPCRAFFPRYVAAPMPLTPRSESGGRGVGCPCCHHVEAEEGSQEEHQQQKVEGEVLRVQQVDLAVASSVNRCPSPLTKFIRRLGQRGPLGACAGCLASS